MQGVEFVAWAACGGYLGCKVVEGHGGPATLDVDVHLEWGRGGEGRVGGTRDAHLREGRGGREGHEMLDLGEMEMEVAAAAETLGEILWYRNYQYCTTCQGGHYVSFVYLVV